MQGTIACHNVVHDEIQLITHNLNIKNLRLRLKAPELIEFPPVWWWYCEAGTVPFNGISRLDSYSWAGGGESSQDTGLGPVQILLPHPPPSTR